MHMPMTKALEIDGAGATFSARRLPTGGRVARGALRVMAWLIALFLLVDGGARLVGFAPYVQGTIEAGYDAHLAPVIGLALLIPTLLYLIPRTAILGGVLVTGYLGGAVATNLRVMNGSLWIIFPVVLGALMWIDLWVRDSRVRAAIGPTR
jgi:DoxX-like family